MKEKIICVLLCAVSVFVMMLVYTYSISADLHDNIVRLHVIANSDSEYDQKIKFKVRDTLLLRSGELKRNGFNTSVMTAITNKVLDDEGAGYSAFCETGDFYFPSKKYANITLPEGRYNGVKIVLGEGKGQNWWCVLSPPMCFTKSTVGEADAGMLSKRLNESTIDVITDRDGVNYKFKLVETVKRLSFKKIAN